MPAKNHLKAEQKEELQKALKEEEHPEIRERILILLLLNDGKTQSEIAKFIGCSLKKVSRWCVRGDVDNIDFLVINLKKGNRQKATGNSEEETINRSRLKVMIRLKTIYSKNLRLFKESVY